MSKDWIGNKKSVYSTLGSSAHSNGEREVNDFYATHPSAATDLHNFETLNSSIWECACGAGHLSKEFERLGYSVFSTDLYDRGYGIGGVDFLLCYEPWHGDIVTNPPYKYAEEFVLKALSLVNDGNKVCMLLRLLFLEGQGRRELFRKYPPIRVWVYSRRLSCAKNGDFSKANSAMAFAWFIWQKGYNGETIIKWI